LIWPLPSIGTDGCACGFLALSSDYADCSVAVVAPPVSTVDPADIRGLVTA
jgi:hypothetical protein